MKVLHTLLFLLCLLPAACGGGGGGGKSGPKGALGGTWVAELGSLTFEYGPAELGLDGASFRLKFAGESAGLPLHAYEILPTNRSITHDSLGLVIGVQENPMLDIDEVQIFGIYYLPAEDLTMEIHGEGFLVAPGQIEVVLEAMCYQGFQVVEVVDPQTQDIHYEIDEEAELLTIAEGALTLRR